MMLQERLGPGLYSKIYDFLKFNRRKGTDEAVMHERIKEIVGGDKKIMSLCFELDGLVFLELLNE